MSDETTTCPTAAEDRRRAALLSLEAAQRRQPHLALRADRPARTASGRLALLRRRFARR